MADSIPMTEAIATPDAPPAAKPKRTLSPEHIAKMQAGRKKKTSDDTVNSASAKITEPSKTTVSDSELAAELARVKAELEAVKAATGFLDPAQVAALPMSECFYEFLADKQTERGEPLGEKIASLDDPRWESLVKLKQQVVGQVIVRSLTRAKSGEILSHEDRQCIPARTPQHARSMMEARAKNPSGQWY